ncbi:hypothetical protein [Sphaerisporangium corydalis]|uniref:Uncharacterized protein n=1 Tax=Sphaerisporangium corydalis TaxID=1441875 RepID=A0ABV9EWV8_9ACTN|nr:hypothetical protein [Sphaerisporangium corydalis]
MGYEKSIGDEMHNPVNRDNFHNLWRELDAEREGKQWSRDQLARKIAQLSGQEISSKTLHDRMSYGRRVPWSEASWVIKALDLDSDLWKKRWSHAEAIRRTGVSSDVESAMPPPTVHMSKSDLALDSMVDTRAKPGSRRRIIALSGIAAVVVAGIAGIWWHVGASDGMGENAAIACAVVAVPHSYVFRSPGDSKPLTIKLRGERITFPREIIESIGPDGHKYRLVRAPTRTSFEYAYMLSETLKITPC